MFDTDIAIIKFVGAVCAFIVCCFLIGDCTGTRSRTDRSISNLYLEDTNLHAEIDKLKVQKQALEREIISDETDVRLLRLRVDQLEWEVDHPKASYPRSMGDVSTFSAKVGK
jgi:hypothetical protein